MNAKARRFGVRLALLGVTGEKGVWMGTLLRERVAEDSLTERVGSPVGVTVVVWRGIRASWVCGAVVDDGVPITAPRERPSTWRGDTAVELLLGREKNREGCCCCSCCCCCCGGGET